MGPQGDAPHARVAAALWVVGVVRKFQSLPEGGRAVRSSVFFLSLLFLMSAALALSPAGSAESTEPCPAAIVNALDPMQAKTSNAVSIQYPLLHSVYQRGPDNQGSVGFIGLRSRPGKGLLIRVRDRANGAIVKTHCEALSSASASGRYAVLLKLPAKAWYFLDISLIKEDNSFERTTLNSFGVGEIFVAAGQSNAANGGEPTGLGPFNKVSSFNPWTQSWQPAQDPMPVATGSWGSPWPLLGSLLAERLNVPVGIVSLACSGTKLDQWRPDAANVWYCTGPQSGNLYSRLKEAAIFLKAYGGFRSILWVQGEADAWYATIDSAHYNPGTYIQNLYYIMYRLNADTRPNTPSGIWTWGVAKASFFPAVPRKNLDDPPCSDQAIAGSATIAPAFDNIWSTGLAFQGPTNDAWIGSAYRWDDPQISACAHFNVTGLRMHASGWYKAIMNSLKFP